MVIRNIDTVHPIAPPNGSVSHSSGESVRAAGEPAASSVSLNITDEAALLQQTGAALHRQAEVDAVRVVKFQQLVANGTYQVDAGRVADKMLRIEQAF